MSEDKHECAGYKKPKSMVGVLHSAHFKYHYKCHSNGTISENGKWWCKHHAPSFKKAREEKNGIHI